LLFSTIIMNSISNIKSLIIDMDGVLWRDTSPIGDLPSIFACIRERGLRFVMATNNSTSTVDEFLDKFRKYGVELEPWQIVTSSLAAVQKLAIDFPGSGTIFVVGENGLRKEMTKNGFTVITDPLDESPVIAVIVGFDREVTYAKLRRASLNIRAGAAFYGTNPDKTFPTPLGLIPGAGAILAAIEAATDAKPIVIGKPFPFLMHMSLERLGTKPEESLVVGDRLETDIVAGKAAKCKTALVLSGVTTQEQVDAWVDKPSMVAENLSALIEQL
jgi:4-nitrophenyl phosphatase